MEKIAPNDPDLTESISSAERCPASDRPRVFQEISDAIAQRSPDTARELLLKAGSFGSPMEHWWNLCTQTMSQEDVALALKTADMTERTKELAIPTHEWKNIFMALRACIFREWELARLYCTLIAEPLYLAQVHNLIACQTGSTEDLRRVRKLANRFKRLSKEPDGQEYSILADLIFPTLTTPSEFMACYHLELRSSRSTARLQKLIDKKMIRCLIDREVGYLVALGLTEIGHEAWGPQELWRADDQELFNFCFAQGYGASAVPSLAREYAVKLRDPAHRAIAFAHVFAAKFCD